MRRTHSNAPVVTRRSSRTPAARWQRGVALAALLVAAACGNDEPDDPSAIALPTTVAFQPAMHLRVDDVGELGRPRIAAGRPGSWLVVWGTADGIASLRSTDDGASWGGRATLDVGTYRAFPQVACDGAGGCLAAWKTWN